MKRTLSLLLTLFCAMAVGLVWVTPALAASNKTVYRLYNPNSGEHFYTTNAGERDATVRAGWKSEGAAWTAPSTSSAPVWRLYSGQDHHYTSSARERDALIRVGWRAEGVSFYSDPAKGVNIYRQYNPNASVGAHNFTPSVKENKELVRMGWKAEGVSFYGVDTSNIPVKSVEVNPKTVQLAEEGMTQQLTATIYPINATDRRLTWSSSDSSIAAVSQSGLVTAGRTGVATVTVRTTNGREASARVSVGIPATKVLSDITGLTVEKGISYLLAGHVSMEPETTTDALAWSSSDPGTATVDDQGIVTAVSPGQVSITATAGSGESTSIDVYVPRKGAVTATGPDPDNPQHWASLWVTSLTITQTEACQRFAEHPSSDLLQAKNLNARASYDGREVAMGDTSMLSVTINDEAWASIKGGVEGTYPCSVMFDPGDGTALLKDTIITVVPNDTVIGRNTEDDPQATVALLAEDAEIEPGTYYGDPELKERLGTRAWIDATGVVDLDTVKITSDSGLRQAMIAGKTGLFDVTLEISNEGAKATHTSTVLMDGPAHLTFLTASMTSNDIKYGTVSSSGEDLPSRATSNASSVTATTETGHEFVGWYAGAVEQGVEPTGEPITTEPTLVPPRPEAGWDSYVTFTAVFRAHSATVTLDPNGGTGGTTSAVVTYGQTPTTEIIAPVLPGYALTGYYVDRNASEQHVVYMDGEVPVWAGPWVIDGDTTIYAGWTPREDTSYTVRHLREQLGEDGTGLGTYEVVEPDTQTPTGTTGRDTVAEPLTTATYEGYTPKPVQQAPVDGNGTTVIDVYYDRNTYQFSFEDWEGFDEKPATQTLWHGQKATIPTAVPDDFAWWAKNEELTEQYDFDEPVTSDTTVYATYHSSVLVELPDGLGAVEYHAVTGQTVTAAQVMEGIEVHGYTVTRLYTDDARTIPFEQVTCTTDPAVVYATLEVAPTPYTVRHWQQRLDQSGHAVAGTTHDEAHYELVETQELSGATGQQTSATSRGYEGFSNEPIQQATIDHGGGTVVDVWYDRVSVTVAFDKNGLDQAVVPSSLTVPYGALIPRQADATAGGYIFGGWHPQDLTAPAWSFEHDSVLVTGTLTLIPSWMADPATPYTVRHELQRIVNDVAVDEFVLDATVTNYGATETEATPIAKSYPGFTPELPTNVGTIAADGSTTVTIKYYRQSYVPTFDMEGHGASVNCGPIVFGGHIPKPADPAEDGWVFKGWYADEACQIPWNFETDTMPAGGATIHASWAVRNWEVVGKAVYDGLPSMVACGTDSPLGDPAPYDTELGAWQVSTPEQLAYVAYLVNGNLRPEGTTTSIMILADLDLAGSTWNGGSTASDDYLYWKPISVISGDITGGRHVISNMTATGTRAALVELAKEESTISELGFHGYTSHAEGTGATASALIAEVDEGSTIVVSDCFAIGTSSAQGSTEPPATAAGLIGTMGSLESGTRVSVSNSYVAPQSFVGTALNAVAPAEATSSNCYFDSSTSGAASFADANPATVAGRPTSVMKSSSLAYALNGGAVGEKWTIDEGNSGYPHFGSLGEQDLVTVALNNGDADTGLDQITIIRNQLAAGAVQAPTRMGYDFSGYYDKSTPPGTLYVDADSTWKLPVISDGLELEAAWTPRDDTPYTVRHWQQKLNDQGTDVAGTTRSEECYALVETDTQTLVGTTEQQTAAVANTYEGFTSQEIEQKEIVGRGTTVVDVYYNRNYYDVTLNLNGPSGSIPSTSPVCFEASVPAPRNPVVSNYGFHGWFKEDTCENAWSFRGSENPDGMPAGGVTLYAAWTVDSWQVVGKAMYDNVATLRVMGADQTVGSMPSYDATTGWQVSTPEQLACVAYMITNRKIDAEHTASMTLAADVDLVGTKWGGTEDSPVGWVPIVNYSGTFDGGRNTIDHMFVSNGSYAALISSIADTTSINDLTLAHARAEGNGGYKSALVATVNGKTLNVTDVASIDANVEGTGYPVAGLVGSISEGSATTLTRCSTQGGTVSTTESTNGFYVAGMVGSVLNTASQLVLDDCFSTTTVTGKSVHGLVGQNYLSQARPCGYTKVHNSYFAGTLNCAEDGEAHPIAWNNTRAVSELTNCYYDTTTVPNATDPGFFAGLRGLDSDHMRDRGAAWELNGRAYGAGVTWTQDDEVNGGYPYFGTLTGPTYDVRLNKNPLLTPFDDLTVISNGMSTEVVEAPYRVGYEFQGYAYVPAEGDPVTYIDATGTWIRDYDIGADAQLKAQWKAKTYPVTLDPQPGEGGTTSVTATYDQRIEQIEVPTWEAHSFLGYFDGADDEAACYVNATGAGTRAWDIDSDEGVTLVAHWKVNDYTVHFDSNGAATAPADQAVAYGGQVTLNHAAYARTGYEFLGWSVDPDATEPDPYLGPTAPSEESPDPVWPAEVTLSTDYIPSVDVTDESSEGHVSTVTLYAVWRLTAPEQTFTYDLNLPGPNTHVICSLKPYPDHATIMWNEEEPLKSVAIPVPEGSVPTVEPTVQVQYVEGYSFAGWVLVSTTVTQSTYRAIWNEVI